MKRLIKKAKSKKLDSDLANFLYTCISMFTYNTNEVLLNQCLSYLNNINIKDISEDEESEMYMYYMKIKSYAIKNDLEDEFEALDNQGTVDKELVGDGYSTDIIVNDGTTVTGDQMVCTYKNDTLGDTYYIFEVGDNFILKSSSDLNTDLLVTANDDTGFADIEDEVLKLINDRPGYVKDASGLVGINTATQNWQDYLDTTSGANTDNSSSSDDDSEETDEEEKPKKKEIKDKTEYKADIKFDSKDIAAINSFVTRANGSRYVVDVNFEQVKDAALRSRLVRYAFNINNIMSGYKSYFPDMNFISAYFKDENKSDSCGLIASVDNYFVALSYSCDTDLDKFKTILNNIYNSQLTDLNDENERTILIAYYNENNKTSELMNEYNEYKQNDQTWMQKKESEGYALDDIAKMIETMEDLAKPESQSINYYSPEYQVAVMTLFLDNAFYAEECDTFEAAEDYIFANNTVHSYTFYDNAYSPSEDREEIEQSPKYYLHVVFYKYYKDSFLTWLENHEKIILNYTDVVAQVDAVPDSK